MTQAQVVSTAIATELLHSVGVEISIFVITVVLAVAIRGAPLGKGFAGKTPCARALQQEQGKSGDAARSSYTSKKSVKSPRCEASSVPIRVAQKIDSMVKHTQRWQCAEALAAYEDLRTNNEHALIKECLSNKSKAAELYSLLVQCAGKTGRPQLVNTIANDMKLNLIERSVAFYEATMKMLAANKLYKEALAMYNMMEADGLEPSPVTLSCLINFAAEVGESQKAEKFFHRLATTSTPSIRAYMTILRVYSKRPDWAKSLALIQDMKHRQVEVDALVLNIVLATGVSAGELFAATALLDEFSNIADVVSYNTLLKGFARQKEADAAIKLLDEMSKAGVKANAITFNTAMDAAVRSGRVADAWGVLVQMLDSGLTPDKFTCTTLMKGLQMGASSKQLDMILDLMRTVNKECDSALRSFLFRNVIEATAKVNDPVLIKKAIAQMREQRVIIPAPEYQRLLRVLMREG